MACACSSLLQMLKSALTDPQVGTLNLPSCKGYLQLLQCNATRVWDIPDSGHRAAVAVNT